METKEPNVLWHYFLDVMKWQNSNLVYTIQRMFLKSNEIVWNFASEIKLLMVKNNDFLSNKTDGYKKHLCHAWWQQVSRLSENVVYLLS